MPSLLLQELILDLNTDVAEFCPGPQSHQQLLAVGTYQLDEASQQRHGRLHLYSLSGGSSDGGAGGSQAHLTLAATLDCPAGIFDLQWTQLPSIHDTPCIGLALADGSMQLLAVAAASPPMPGDTITTASTSPAPHQLQQLCSCQAVSDGMALYLDWNQQQQQQAQEVSTNLAAVSSSSGSIAVIQAEPTGLTQLLEWQAHDLEAWVVSWDKHNANVLYSGADDSTFKAWDVRCQPTTAVSTAANSSGSGGCEQQEQQQEQEACSISSTPPSALFSNRRAHGAGVCCISSHPRREHVLVTGSYDEAARLWDVRMLQRPVETCQVSTGGGVWRLKWHPRNDNLLLAACMYNGFALLQVNDRWDTLQVVEEYKGHDSIAYGADWYKGQWPLPACSRLQGPSSHQQPDSSAAGDVAQHLNRLHLEQQPADVIATCSFYDRRLHLWTPDFKS